MTPQKVRFKKRETQDFHTVVKERVHQWFKSQGLSPHANKVMWVKCFTLLFLYFSIWGLILSDHFQGGALIVLFSSFGVIQALMGFNISHDALHGSFTNSSTINRYIGYCFDWNGESSFVWKKSHNIQHHTYTNITGLDEDINKAPLLRFSPHDPWRPLNRFQHLYTLPLYAMISFTWIYWGDWSAMVEAGKKGQTRVKDWVIFSLFKCTNFFLMIILPFAALSVPIGLIIAGLIIMNLVASLVLSVVFQLAHLVEGVEFPLPDRKGNISSEWAEHEMKTTSNFATDNPVLTWFLGGLNFQVEHHLFPHICHVHYPKIALIVKKTAKEFNLPYHEQPTFTKAFISHLKLLKQFGNPHPEPQKNLLTPS